jgi:hypothetical protein
MREAEKLRELAAWYREFAERAGNPSIWESRILMAEDLQQEADRLDRHAAEFRGRRLEPSALPLLRADLP